MRFFLNQLDISEICPRIYDAQASHEGCNILKHLEDIFEKRREMFTKI